MASKTEQRRMAKGEAFNSILRIYHPKAEFHYFNYTDESRSEQRECSVRDIMDKYFEKLKKINLK